jgi:glycosyltransferase involved in cell wall biosynthesis
MKVLWIINGSESFGEKRAVCSLMRGVRASGWEAAAASLMQGECAEALASEGLSIHFMNLGDSPGMHRVRGKIGKLWQIALLMGHQLRLIGPIRRAIRASGADVVHVLDKNILPAVAWAARRENKVCFWEMTTAMGTGYPFNLNHRMHSLLVRWLHVHPLANSRNTAQPLVDVGCPVDVMYLGVDSRMFDPARRYPDLRSSLHIPRDAPVFTIVARADPMKGQKLFLQAMLQVANPEMHLLLVGMDPNSVEAIEIRTMVEAAAVDKRVHFIGFSPRPEEYLASTDVPINAYIGMEGFGLSAVEGMMMEKPVLVHASGGPAETVVDNETGWHVAGATVEDFAAGIRRALADRPRWREMGIAARARALALYSLETQTQRYRSLIEASVAPPKNSGAKS